MCIDLCLLNRCFSLRRCYHICSKRISCKCSSTLFPFQEVGPLMLISIPWLRRLSCVCIESKIHLRYEGINYHVADLLEDCIYSNIAFTSQSEWCQLNSPQVGLFWFNKYTGETRRIPADDRYTNKTLTVYRFSYTPCLV